MTTVNPEGITDAVIQLLKDATWTETPTIIDIGDYSYYPENPIITDDLPAIFVRPIEMETDNSLDLAGEEIRQEMVLRIVFVDSWDETEDNVERLKLQRGSEMLQAFIRLSGDDYRLDDSVSGVTIESTTLGKLEFVPPEHASLSHTEPVQNRRLYAIALNLSVLGRATR